MHFWLLGLDARHHEYTTHSIKIKGLPGLGTGGWAVWHVGSAQTRPDRTGPGAEGEGLMSPVPRPPGREDHSPFSYTRGAWAGGWKQGSVP